MTRAKKIWKCPHCAQTSTRNWNLKTHIRRYHGGIGFPIVGSDAIMGQFTHDYDDHNNQHDYLGPPVKTNFGTRHGIAMQSNRRDPLYDMSCFISKNNYLLNQIMEFTKLLNQLSSSSSTSNSMPVQAKPNLSQLNSEIVQREQHIPHTNPRQVLGLKIFYTCDKCLEGCISPVPVFCPDNEAGNDDIVHCCKPERVLTIKNILSDLRRSFEYSQIKNNSFQCLKDFVSARNYEYLISIPLSNPVPEVLLLNNPDKPDIPIRIWYSKESCVELNLDKLRNDNYDYTNNHWAVRAIAQKLVRLTNNEASQFLETVGTATYGFFKIRLNRSVYNLFLILNDILGARRILLYNC